MSVLSFNYKTRDWSNQEIAEFYRVEAALCRSGLLIETERGISDEGDPWFIFCRADSGDIIIHFARFDGQYVVASPALESIVRGNDFRRLIVQIIDCEPIVLPPSKNRNLFIHPAALLFAIVSTCYFKLFNSNAHAEEAPIPTPSLAHRGHFHSIEALNQDASISFLVTAMLSRSISERPCGGHLPTETFPSTSDVVTSGFVLNNQFLDELTSSKNIVISRDAKSEAPQNDTTTTSVTLSVTHLHDLLLNESQSPDSFGSSFLKFHNRLDVPEVIYIQEDQATASPITVAPISPFTAVSSNGGEARPSEAIREVNHVLGIGFLSSIDHKLEYASEVIMNAFKDKFKSSELGPSEIHSQTVNEADVSKLPVDQTAEISLKLFIATHHDFGLLKIDDDLVIYDGNIRPWNIADVEKVFFKFEDGSTLIIVGLPTHSNALELV